MDPTTSSLISKAFSAVEVVLTGRENYNEWAGDIEFALIDCDGTDFIDTDSRPHPEPGPPHPPLAGPEGTENQLWLRKDSKIAVGILKCTSAEIRAQLKPLVHLEGATYRVWRDLKKQYGANDEQPLVHLEGATYRVWRDLKKQYGANDEQYIHNLGREFIGATCNDSWTNDQVGEWIVHLDKLYDQLNSAKFDLPAMYTNILLSGIPSRFDQWKMLILSKGETERENRTEIRNGLKRLLLRPDHDFKPAMSAPLDPAVALVASDGSKRIGGACYLCKSPKHWADLCPQRKTKKAAPAAAVDKSAVRKVDSQLATYASAPGFCPDLDAAGDLCLVAQNRPTTTQGWILDSGATTHMTGNAACVTNLVNLDPSVPVTTASGGVLAATQVGETSIVNHEGKLCRLGNVLFVPGLDFSLVSVSALTRLGVRVTFEDETCLVTKGDVVLFKAQLGQRAWIISFGDRRSAKKIQGKVLRSLVGDMPKFLPSGSKTYSTPTVALSAVAAADWDVWHRRVGHLNTASMKLLFGTLSTGASISNHENKDVCDGCVAGKIVRPPFPSSASRANNPLELIHMDLCEMLVESLGGAKYMMVLVDDSTRYLWAYFLRRKSDAISMFKDWRVHVERQINHKVLCIRTDNGGEFVKCQP